MLKKITFITCIAIPFLISTPGYSQLNTFSISLTGGYNLSNTDLSGMFSGITGKYYISNSLAFGVKAKYNLDGSKHISIIASATDNPFSNDKTDLSSYYSQGVPITITSGKISMNILSVNTGIQINLSPNERVNSFLNLEYMNNFYSGSLKFNFSDNEGNTGAGKRSLSPAYRGGVQFGGGFEIKTKKNIEAIIGLNYIMSNLFNRSTTNNFENIDNNYHLNDGGYYKDWYINSSKTISYFQLYTGISILFGKEKKITDKDQHLNSGRWSFNAIAGLNFAAEDLKAENIPSESDGTYKQKNGFNAGAAVNLALDNKGSFLLSTSFNYNNFTHEINYNSSVYYNGKTYTETRVDYTSNLSILSAGIGFRYNFLPNKKFAPFINTQLTNNFFSGYSRSSETLQDMSNITFKKASDLKTAFRLGIQLGAGIDINLYKELGLLLGVNYNVANLIGRSYQNSYEDAFYSLNDASPIYYGDSFGSSKAISYLQFYTGISFYPGRILKNISKSS